MEQMLQILSMIVGDMEVNDASFTDKTSLTIFDGIIIILVIQIILSVLILLVISDTHLLAITYGSVLNYY